ncbi:MAG: M64 family metallopeptidase [Pseudomonadota bacterium]
MRLWPSILIGMVGFHLAAVSMAQVEVQVQPDGNSYATVLQSGAFNKIDLVFVGEGFTESEQVDFNNAVQSVLSWMQQLPPFSNELCALNIWRVNAISPESGIDDLANNINRDTAFDVRLGLASFGEVPRGFYTQSFDKIYEAAGYAPDVDSVVVLVNHSDHGGLAVGDVAFASIGGAFTNVTTHELGHSIGGLADEYQCYICDGSDNGRAYPADLGEPDQPNITTDLDRDTTKWGDLIDAATPVPTVQNTPPGVVGLWEGGGYYATGMYRPREQCHMDDSSVASFCPVCDRTLSQVFFPYCHIQYLPDLRITLIEFIPQIISAIRWPIPVCLSCPPFDMEVSLVLTDLEVGDGAFQILNNSGEPVLFERSAKLRELRLTFAAESGEAYFLEYAPGQKTEAVRFKTDVRHRVIE